MMFFAERRDNIILAALLIIGAALRLWAFDLSAFNIDESIAAIYSIQFAIKGEFPLVGVKTSLQFYNSPLLIFILAPFYSAASSPLVAQSAVTAVGMGLIALAARMGREMLGGRWWVILALFIVFSPVCLLTSRRMWGHSFIPFLSTFVFYHMWLWIARDRARSLFWIPLGILWAQQLHFSGALLWINLGVIVALFRPRLYGRYFAAGCIGGALPYLPYLVHNGGRDVAIIIKSAIWGADRINPSDIDVMHVLYQWFGDMGRNDMLGRARLDFFQMFDVYNAIIYLFAAVMFLGIGFLSFDLFKLLMQSNEGTTKFNKLPVQAFFPVLCLIWIIIPLSLFNILQVTFVPYYLLPMFPAPFVLAAVAFKRIGEWKRWSREGIAVLLAVLCLAQTAYWGSMIHYLTRADMTTPVQTCLRYQDQAVAHIYEESGGKKTLVVRPSSTASSGIEYGYNYLLWRYEGLNPTRFFTYQDFDKCFIIRDSKDYLHGRMLDWMEGLPHERFGNIVVYETNRERIFNTDRDKIPKEFFILYLGPR